MVRSASAILSGEVPWALHTFSIRPSPLDRPPAVRVLEQRVRLGGTPGARGVLRQLAVHPAPRLEDRVADPPRGLNLVVAGEKGRVAAHRVEDQPLVCL